MSIDIDTLISVIQAYPNDLRKALQQERSLADRIEILEDEIAELDVAPSPVITPDVQGRPSYNQSPYSILHEDIELKRINRDLEQLQQKKLITVARDPAAFGLAARPTQKMIEAAVAEDAEVSTLQKQANEREDLLFQQHAIRTAEQVQNIEPAISPVSTNDVDMTRIDREYERKERELAKTRKALREATIEREVIERAIPRMYELLIQLSRPS